MPYVEVSIDIDAPPEDVWEVLTDLERWPGWTQSVHSVRMKSDGPFAVGTKARLDLAGAPPTDWTVTDVEPGRSFTWESKSPGVHSVASHLVEPRKGGSRVTLTVRQGGVGATLLSPFLTWVSKRNLKWESEGLKRRCETTRS